MKILVAALVLVLLGHPMLALCFVLVAWILD